MSERAAADVPEGEGRRVKTAPDLKCAVGQVWRRRHERDRVVGETRLEITRLAGRSAFGKLTVSSIDLVARSQVLYTELAAKWERVK